MYIAICVPTHKIHIERHIAIYRSLGRRAFSFADTAIKAPETNTKTTRGPLLMADPQEHHPES